MTQSNGSISDFLDKLFYDNEIYTNRLTSYAVAVLGCALIMLCILNRMGIYDLGGNAMERYIFAVGLMQLFAFLVAKSFAYKEAWVKKFLLGIVLLSSGTLFFFYPMSTSFMIYGPVMISALYFDKKLILNTSLITWIVYTVTIWSNVYLEQTGGIIHDLHALEETAIWKYPYDVFKYRYIPNTMLFVISAIICNGISRRGILFLSKQAQASAQIADVEAELKMAAHIQQASLPQHEYCTDDGRISVRAFMQPAKVVGGDFYDYFIINKSFIFLVADVSDKGLSAAMFMMRAKNAIRSAFNVCDNLKDAVLSANRKLCKNNQDNMFVTMWVGSVDMCTGVGKYVNCGHPSPIIKRADGGIIQLINKPDLMLGVFEDAEFSDHPFWLFKNDTMLLFTDGLTDSTDSSGNAYGNIRLVDTIQEISKEADNLCIHVCQSVEDFASGTSQFDDMTALSIAFKAANGYEENDFTFSSSYESIENMIDLINSMLADNSCPEEVRRNIDVAIDEVCGNIVDYAYPNNKGNLEINIKVGRNFIRIAISDNGIPFNPLEAEAPDVVGEPSVGGLGIFLAKNIMDGIKYIRLEDKNQIVLLKVWNM